MTVRRRRNNKTDALARRLENPNPFSIVEQRKYAVLGALRERGQPMSRRELVDHLCWDPKLLLAHNNDLDPLRLLREEGKVGRIRAAGPGHPIKYFADPDVGDLLKLEAQRRRRAHPGHALPGQELPLDGPGDLHQR